MNSFHVKLLRLSIVYLPNWDLWLQSTTLFLLQVESLRFDLLDTEYHCFLLLTFSVRLVVI